MSSFNFTRILTGFAAAAVLAAGTLTAGSALAHSGGMGGGGMGGMNMGSQSHNVSAQHNLTHTDDHDQRRFRFRLIGATYASRSATASGPPMGR